ncbi:F0F1 ATP synthase subunit delta [Corynebacterium uterequi]|uniref:ATP synthase subunit delta n=1 Tax=Corynebacterium uterequi TaxID=1072256 RepID=A0A0G3HID0_9CORY|nr:F0F1 ATP synthase subunit delta [Corynebacterium uterequi]AKK10897.1 ATP synthase F1 subcomplex delta subunit [Corynebacterium uterequi]
MHAASREALQTVASKVDELVTGDHAVVLGAQTGIELFEVVGLLDEDRALRVAVSDPAATAQQRAGIADALFGGKVSDPTASLLRAASTEQWSSSNEFRRGLVLCGRRALLRAAEAQGQLEAVEDELFALSRLLDREGELTQLLSDRTAASSAKRGLLANVLYGKVTMFTEALALQVIGRPERNPIDDLAAIAAQAAELRGRTVAHVVSSGALNDGQQAALAEKLGRIYGREMAIHTEVDPSLLGGVTIRVGDEIIDGSTRGKLTRMRAALA